MRLGAEAAGMHPEQRGNKRFGAQKGNERASGNRETLFLEESSEFLKFCSIC